MGMSPESSKDKRADLVVPGERRTDRIQNGKEEMAGGVPGCRRVD